jgi:hypothetical protein
LLTVFSFFPAIPVGAQSILNASQFELYGFVRLDGVYDDSRMQHNQHAFWVLSEDSRFCPQDDSHLTVHPRLTRLGLRMQPKDIGDGVKARAVLEVDFQNGGSESREILRMRVGYFEITRSDFIFRAGQDWDVISPLYPGVHLGGLMWNAGNLGDRHPQAWLAWKPGVADGDISTTIASGLTGAVDNKDLDANGLLDGSESGQPFLQARIGTEQSLWTNRPSKAGLWGHWAKEEMTANGELTTCESWVAGFDASIPLTGRVSIEAEGWVGENLSDLRGGIGQGVNALTCREVGARGGWAQLAINPVDKWRAYVGGTVDDPDNDDVPSLDDVQTAGLPIRATGRTLNWSVFVSNHFRPWQPVQVGFEYQYWVTEFRGLNKGVSNRYNLHFGFYF